MRVTRRGEEGDEGDKEREEGNNVMSYTKAN